MQSCVDEYIDTYICYVICEILPISFCNVDVDFDPVKMPWIANLGQNRPDAASIGPVLFQFWQVTPLLLGWILFLP